MCFWRPKQKFQLCFTTYFQPASCTVPHLFSNFLRVLPHRSSSTRSRECCVVPQRASAQALSGACCPLRRAMPDRRLSTGARWFTTVRKASRFLVGRSCVEAQSGFVPDSKWQTGMSGVGWLASPFHHRVAELAHAGSRATSSNNRCVALESRFLEWNSLLCLTRFRSAIEDRRFPALSSELTSRTHDSPLILFPSTT